MLSQFLRKVYNGFDTESEIEPGIWREVLRVLNDATVQGLTQSQYTPSVETDRGFLHAIRHSNEVFAAFKVHMMGRDMAAKLIDTDGNLKPFDRWMRDVSGITSHQIGSWLRTEYDTAVIRAHAAADWQEFERNKYIFPNLKWMPTTSPEPEGTHARYWRMGLTLPVDDPFWDDHHPGDRWNCKCSLEATDEPVNRPDDLEETKPHRGLENNPGKDGKIFNDTHPYFPKNCSQCFANSGFKNRLKGLFINQGEKHCNSCPLIDNKMKKAADKMRKASDVPPPSVETYRPSHNGKVMTSPYHGSNEVDENKRLGAFVADKLGQKVYLLPRLDPRDYALAPLRPTLLPSGVFPNKNPDFYIGGLLFDGKSMMGIRRGCSKKKYHNDILNRIKDAKKQADNVVLEIPTFVSRRTIGTTVNGYLKQSSKQRIIIVKHGSKCYVYK
ncbi:MAG: hypothetical protein K6E45_01475 [Bacteroidaceae bacterium]|nr:hypothetical protein [Bacteroidaceae bacterium]